MRFKDRNARLAFLFQLVYFTSYITRINYSAVISEMITTTGMSKPMLSMALTGSFITYGAGQIISGICGDHFSPKKLVAGGLFTASAMNFCIPFCQNHYQMLAVWCVNGFAQAFMWPPMAKMMADFFTKEEFDHYIVNVSAASSVGTIAVYLTAPAIISLSGWKAVFICSAVFGFSMMFVWNRFCEDKGNKPKPEVLKIKETGKGAALTGAARVFLTPLMICIMLAIICQGMLRDSVVTWIPSYIAETYHLNNSIAILTSVVLPIFSVLMFQLAGKLYRDVYSNPVLCAAVFFLTATVSSVGLYLVSGQNAAASVVFAAVFTGCMYGINMLLIGMIPAFFIEYGNVSTVSGVLNGCTYIGSAVSTYGIAVLAEAYSWKLTLFIWMLISAAGTVLCLITIRPWIRRFPNE